MWLVRWYGGGCGIASQPAICGPGPCGTNRKQTALNKTRKPHNEPGRGQGSEGGRPGVPTPRRPVSPRYEAVAKPKFLLGGFGGTG
jgi:hypothetical protein